MPEKVAKTTGKTKEEKAKILAEQEAALKKFAKEKNLVLLNWPPERLMRFAKGLLTVAGLENMSQKRLYDLADVGYRLMSQGRLDDAQKVFEGMVVLDPYDSYFRMVLGSICQRKNNLTVAEKHYTKALEMNQGLLEAYVNRGEVRLLLKKFPEAITDFGNAIKLDEESKSPAVMRARVMLIAITASVAGTAAKTGVVR